MRTTTVRKLAEVTTKSTATAWCTPSRGVATSLTAIVMVASLSVTTPAFANTAPAGNASLRAEDTALLAEAATLPTMKVTDAQELDTPVITTGTVRQEGARASATGAPVRMLAWPRLEDLKGVKEGESFVLKPIGRTITGPDGSFVLRVDPSIALDEFTSENGNIDVSILVDSTDGKAGWEATIPRDIMTGATVADVDSDEIGTMPRALDLELVDTDATIDQQQVENLSSDDQEMVIASHEDLGDRRVRIGFINRVGTSATVWFQYSYSDSSSLGVGVSYNHGASWSASGRVSREAGSVSSPAGVSGTSMNRHYYTWFNYRKYRILSPGGYYIRDEVRAYDHAGGMVWYNTTSAFSEKRENCLRYYEGDYTFSSVKAKYWSTGAELNGVIGINLSSQTGYTEGASQKFRHRTNKRDICGEYLSPGRTSGTVGRLKSVYRG